MAEGAQTSLESLKRLSRGSPGVPIALIDGPVQQDHPGFAGAELRQLRGGDAFCGLGDDGANAGLGCEHGTAVAGVLVAARDSGAPAIAPASPLLIRPVFCGPLETGQCAPVHLEELARAIHEGIDAGAKVINLSVGAVGGRPESRALEEALDRARAAGALVIAAAANPGAHDHGSLLDHPWVIPAHVDRSAGAQPFGPPRGLLAPGREVISLSAAGGLAPFTGASAAAPFVSGVVALLMSLHPDIRVERIRQALLNPAGIRPQTAEPQRLQPMESHMALTSPQAEPATMQPVQAPAVVMEQLLPADQEAQNQTAASNPQAVPASVAPATPAIQPTMPMTTASAVQPISASIPATQVRPAGEPMGYVYAVGRLRIAFPSKDIEEEYLTAARTENATERDYYKILSKPQYLYIARSVCWLLEIFNVDSYFLHPRSKTELDALIDAFNPKDTPNHEEMRVLVIGPKGPMTDPDQCHGLIVPQVLVNQVYSFTDDALRKHISENTKLSEQIISGLIEDLEFKPNPGDTDRDRALNYITLRFSGIYHKLNELDDESKGFQLVHIQARPSAVQAGRRIVDVIFDFKKYQSGEEVFWYCSVDVTGQFPFMNTDLRQFIPEERQG